MQTKTLHDPEHHQQSEVARKTADNLEVMGDGCSKRWQRRVDCDSLCCLYRSHLIRSVGDFVCRGYKSVVDGQIRSSYSPD